MDKRCDKILRIIDDALADNDAWVAGRAKFVRYGRKRASSLPALSKVARAEREMARRGAEPQAASGPMVGFWPAELGG